MKRLLAICILSSPAALAQSTVTGSRTVQGNWDASGASATKPAKAGATLPGTCSQGEFFFNTAAGSGQNIYLCNPSNAWSQVSAGGVTSVFGRSGAITAATGDYLAAQVTNAVDATGSYTNPTWISSLAWGKLSGVPSAFAPTAHNLLSSAHADTSTATVARGAIITGQGASPTWSILALGATTRYLRSNGTDLLYSLVPAAGAGACSAGQVMVAGNDNAAPTCAAPAYSWLTGVPGVYYQTVQSNTVNQTQRANLNFSPRFSDTDSPANNSTTVDLAANVRARAIGATFSGGGAALTVGTVNYFTVPFACTISAWSMTVDTGTATIDVWKTATGIAIPTAANTITAAATPAISSGTALHSTTLTGWTTSVSANDIIAFRVTAVSNTTLASLVLECDQ